MNIELTYEWDYSVGDDWNNLDLYLYTTIGGCKICLGCCSLFYFEEESDYKELNYNKDGCIKRSRLNHYHLVEQFIYVNYNKLRKEGKKFLIKEIL